MPSAGLARRLKPTNLAPFKRRVHSEAKSQARRLLPQMPEEIFQLWLDGRIEANGWPPVGDVWDAALRHRSFQIWQRLQWRKELLHLDLIRMHPATVEIVQSLSQAYFDGMPNSYSAYLGDSRPRFTSIMNHVQRHRQLPSVLIFLADDSLYDVVDGCHRLALFFRLRRDTKFQNLLSDTQIAWIGYEPDGVACQTVETH